jgi:GTPase
MALPAHSALLLGKSSLLCAMSRAGPRVAPYPFTTLNPFVGVVEYRDGFRLKAADIPGLIDGASQGRGKGIEFLRHLERTKALLYIVDAAGTDGRDPIEDLKILAKELSSYGDGDMLSRKALVVANKLDLLKEGELDDIMMKLEIAAEEAGIRLFGDVLGISAGVSGEGLSPLSQAMRSIVLQSHGDNVIDA